jgi:hypothetical protein
MAALSQYLEGNLIAHLFQTTTYAKPSLLAIALTTVAPTATDTGASLVGKEVTGGGYARLSGSGTTNPSTSNWASPTGGNGTTSNLQVLTFSAATADWSTITSVAILDNVTAGAGNVLFWGTLSGNKVCSNGDTFSFAAGSLTLALS